MSSGGDDALAGGYLAADDEAELKRSIDAVVGSPSPRKLVVAGPGTGKTTLFRKLLEASPGDTGSRLVLTFVNTLKDDLEDDLAELASVFTLHAYCLSLLHKSRSLRRSLSEEFACCPGLASLIGEDWKLLMGSKPPKFVSQMRSLNTSNELRFYFRRGKYYDAVDFDDTVFRVLAGLRSGRVTCPRYDLVLIDEYQDFNALEAGVVDCLAADNRIVIAGDDDQALYSQLRDASWEHIRNLTESGSYELFSLPFCMRCPEVIVDAVEDVLAQARHNGKLTGRIEKPYKFFAPVKAPDSNKYPRILSVCTSCQSLKCNYMGRYICEAVKQIPADELAAAVDGGYPAALVIAARPYRDQILRYLQDDGCTVKSRKESPSGISRGCGLEMLKRDCTSNLGWRVILHCDQPAFAKSAIGKTSDGACRLVEGLPEAYVSRILSEAEAYTTPDVSDDDCPTPDEVAAIEVTSFEGAKGLSAGHVFIVGLHNGELPADPTDVKDLEICKFLVGLTRTRQKCTLLRSNRFGGVCKKPSSFLSWIDRRRLQDVYIDKGVWTAGHRQ